MSESRRYASVDVLRGLAVAAMLLVNNPGDWSHVYPPLLHAVWNGFTPTDLASPVLLFVVGVSLALGLVPRLEPVYRIGFAQWMAPRWGPCLPSLVYAPAFVSLWWGIVYAMDRRGILLRI